MSRIKKIQGIEHPLEEALWDEYESILGMDEAGRGPLCGPLVVAGVVFEKGFYHPEITDSKKLSEKKREELFQIIKKEAKDYCILIVSEVIIDELNIYRATQQAMETIAKRLDAGFVLSDAMPLPSISESQPVIKGDSKSISIAAASILAKVIRDHYMEELDLQYPQYGLKKHKGYPTKAHLEAIEKWGLQDFYRNSYKPVARIREKEEQKTLFDFMDAD